MLEALLTALFHLKTPLDPLHGDGYQFWSGIGAGSPFVAGLFVFWRRHNCHVERCPRIQFKPHPDDDGHIVCRKHHPS